MSYPVRIDVPEHSYRNLCVKHSRLDQIDLEAVYRDVKECIAGIVLVGNEIYESDSRTHILEHNILAERIWRIAHEIQHCGRDNVTEVAKRKVGSVVRRWSYPSSDVVSIPCLRLDDSVADYWLAFEPGDRQRLLNDYLPLPHVWAWAAMKESDLGNICGSMGHWSERSWAEVDGLMRGLVL